jgi:hypothetical protein
MTRPLVSVVSSVYNGSRYLTESLHSVLAQQGVDFELVVVDDGSTDESPRLLADLAHADSRVRVIRQDNQGLTKALIHGCAEARGQFIARHDADDLSLPGRLARQAQLLNSDPRLSMASCWSQAIGPASEELFQVVRPDDPVAATETLLAGAAGPPGHGSVMFRADDYQRAGGYRAAFRYAQDWDLWLRLAEHGRIAYHQAVLYAYRIMEGSISAHRRAQQEQLRDVARACLAARQAGQPEQPHLDRAAEICARTLSPGRTVGEGNSYFIGKCLLDRRDRRALPYLKRSVRLNPWKWRHWAALGAAALLCRRTQPKGQLA